MANVSEKIEKIRESVYGKEVRDSIASSIEAMNEECTEAVGGYTSAIQTASSAAETAIEKSKLAEQSAGKADAQAKAAQTAAKEAERAVEEIQKLDVTELKSQVSDLSGNVDILQDSMAELKRDKVDKAEGKGLSSNDFTSEYKKALDDLAPQELTTQFQVTGSLAAQVTLKKVVKFGSIMMIAGELKNISDKWIFDSDISIKHKTSPNTYLPGYTAPVHFGANNSGFATSNLDYNAQGGFYGYIRSIESSTLSFQILYLI